MKRPLCVMSLIMAAIVFVYLEIFSSTLTVYKPEDPDGEQVSVVGVVSEKQKKLSFLGEPFTVIYIVPNRSLNGNYKYIECYLSNGSFEPSIGETILVSGTVSNFVKPGNPGEFDSQLYYSTLKIAYRLKKSDVLKSDGKKDYFKESLYRIRCFFEKSLDKCLPGEDAAIMKAMLLGDKAFMDDEIKELYKNSGIMHILAVSGLHISIIGMGLYKLLRKLKIPNPVSVFFPILFMFCYGAMCGMNTSAFRAILMFALRLIAPFIGRTYDILSSLSLAAILLLIDQPLYLYNSGFLFSFGAIIGIVVIKPLMEPACLKEISFKMKFVDEDDTENEKRWLKDGSVIKNIFTIAADGFLTCVSIMIITLPVYTSFYYTVPVGSLILNLIILPLMGILMTLGITVMLTGSLSVFLGQVPGIFVHFILVFYKYACSISNLSGRLTWYVGHSTKVQNLLYAFFIIIFISIGNYIHSDIHKFIKTRSDAIKLDLFKVLFLFISIVILTFKIHPNLEINMIDVGQGDGILISCSGKNMLIDGGSTSKKNVGKYQIIPFLKYKGIRMLDTVVITHEDQDHISGVLEIMDDMEKGGIRVKTLILPEISEVSMGENYHKLEKHAKSLKIPIMYINMGESFMLGKAKFTCLNPELNMVTEGANAYSTVLFMEYEESQKNGDNNEKPFTALFTGDVEGEGLEYIKSVIRSDPNRYRKLSLLKVAHHGSQYTSDEEFLSLTMPQIAIISCGVDNSYGHPHKELLERLADIDSKIFRTDVGGCLTIQYRNEHINVKQFLCD